MYPHVPEVSAKLSQLSVSVAALFIERLFPRLHLRRSTRVGAWNRMFRSEVRDKRTDQRDCHQPQLSPELSRLDLSVTAFSEVRRHWSDWISGGGYTYYPPASSTRHLEGMAVDVDNRTPIRLWISMQPLGTIRMTTSHVIVLID